MAAREADTHAGAPAQKHRRFHDLGPRVFSGVTLAALGVGAACLGGWWLAAAAALGGGAMSFEWTRMSEPQSRRSAFIVTIAASLGAVLLAALGHVVWAMGWLGAGAVVSALRRDTWTARAESGLGVVYVGAPGALFLWLRDRGPEGLHTALFLFAVIWLADVFAYLGGVSIGGPRLHPALSPQKTWSGLACGVLAGAMAGYVFARVIGAPAPGLCAAAGFALAACGLAGDLFESFLKRRFGVKDASGLIPGHGGVLDRIDGLMAAAFATAAICALFPAWPAHLLGVSP